MIVIINIDDLIIFKSNIAIMELVKSNLKAEYIMKDIGELLDCLGVEFKGDHVACTITMSQIKFIEEVLKGFNREE